MPNRLSSGMLAALLLGAWSCTMEPTTDFELHGHRGARGWLPENTIPGFLLAVDQGVDAIEVDVVISADSQVVISHEPWMSAAICSHPDGRPVTQDEARSLNLYRMTYAEIARFDCGVRGNPGFPEQRPAPAVKPLLRDAAHAVREHAGPKVRFNVEIKAGEGGDGVWHPDTGVFARLVHDVMAETGILRSGLVQSFDPRVLEAFHALDPDATLGLLVDNGDGLDANLARLAFRPAYYNPHHERVDGALVDAVHALGIRIVPWTVNDADRMRVLRDLGVDGLITDYPDRAATLR